MAYYSAIKWTEVLTPATTWINPENTRSSERSQSHVIQLGSHKMAKVGKSTEMGSEFQLLSLVLFLDHISHYL